MTTESTEIKTLNEELDHKVEERTRELAMTNEALRSEIAELKLAEEAVRQAEDRIRLVIDTIPAMAWSLRCDGAVDFVNQRWMDYTGLSFGDAIEEPTRIMHPEELPMITEKWLASKAAGQPFEVEMRLRRADGEYRWFLVRTAPLLDVRGNIVKWYGTSTDIEDRKRAETQSRLLIDAIPQEIWSALPDGTNVYVNDRWRADTGLEVKDMQGDGWQSIIHPGDRERVLKAWQESVDNGTPYEQEERHQGADGTFRWYLNRGVALRDPQGRIVRWYGTNTDIEERKRAEEALNAQALRYKTLLETSNDSIYVLNANGDLHEANAAFFRRRNFTASEVKGLNVADWDAQWSPEQLQEKLRKLVGSSAVFETRHRCKDGSVFDVEVCATSVRIGGEQLFFCVTRDITERKQAEDRLRRSEEKFKTLFGIAPVGISVLDRQHNIVDANPALEQITGLSKKELLNGAYRRRTYLNADGTPKPAKELPSEHAVMENRPINDVETGIVTETGEIIWTQVSAAPLALPDVSAVVITQDITERKRAAKELEDANHQLRFLSQRLFEVQEEERRHLARELHDEIIQTLTAAKLNLKIIAPDLPTSVASRLEDSTQLLDRLLGQVRELSLDLRPPLLDDLGLVPALRWLAGQQAQRARLRVTFTANVERLEMDPPSRTACFRVAQEAITNAIRHARAVNVAVELRAEPDRVWLIVRDDGVGFDKCAMQQRATHGASLGLLSMKERVSLLRGELEFSSAPGRGAEIRAWFPLAPPGPDATAVNA